MIKACPEVDRLLTDVPVATEPPYDQVRVRKDYSYWKTSLWTPGMALVGDAACFVDPVLSSGVHLATYGALLAARVMNSSLDGSAPEERGFAEFEARYRREYGVFYEFLIAFYDMERNEDSYFRSAKKITRVEVDEVAAFAELAGGVASGDTGTLATGGLGTRWSTATAELEGAVGRLATARTRSSPPGPSARPSAPATTSRNRPCTAPHWTPRPHRPPKAGSGSPRTACPGSPHEAPTEPLAAGSAFTAGECAGCRSPC
ncbi:tryptophan 7-halogenase [Streptomyces sp. NPDC096040]|uniref:tryptophan 7-halogenase n=1 Tax=Streptomyces sp. NPDC096040 TaxID=3155541 RepID=UPI003333F9DD